MQLIRHDGIETVVTLSEKNITELYENMQLPGFRGLTKLQEDPANNALDQRIISVRIEGR